MKRWQDFIFFKLLKAKKQLNTSLLQNEIITNRDVFFIVFYILVPAK